MFGSLFAPETEFSEAFCELIGETFCEAQRRQLRHSDIDARFAPTDKTWQYDIDTRLIGFSGIGIFEFDLLATSMPNDFLFVDAEHPMVQLGHLPTPGPDAVITRLRAMYPNVPEFQSSSLPIDDVMIHAICCIAVVKTDALFYYRCPNDADQGSAMWAIVHRAVDLSTLTKIPANLETQQPPSAEFGSYDAHVQEYEAARPRGSRIRLNDFRLDFPCVLDLCLPTVMKDLFMGFVVENGYETHEQQVSDDERPNSSDVRVDVLVDGSSVLTCTFNSFGDLLEMETTISTDAYP